MDKNLYNKAAQKIKELKKWYELHKNTVLSPQNFKVYDVSCYYMSEKMRQEYPHTYAQEKSNNEYTIFSLFCDDEYSSFKDYNDIELCQYVGRTSTFYLVPDVFQNYDKRTFYTCYDNVYQFIECTTYALLNDISNEVSLSVDEDFNIIFDEDTLESTKDEELEELCKIDLDTVFKDCIEFYNNLQDFKLNQVAIFKQYLDDSEEDLKTKYNRQKHIDELHRSALVYYRLKNSYLSDADKKILEEEAKKYDN